MISTAKFADIAGQSGTGAAWTNPNAALYLDDNYSATAALNTTSQTLKIQAWTFDVPIPTNATINSVTAVIRCRASADDLIRVDKLNWYVEGVTDTEDNRSPQYWPESVGEVRYQDRSKIEWTPAILNSDYTGYELAVAQDDGTGGVAEITFAGLEVEWETPTLSTDLCTTEQVKTYLGSTSFTDAQIEAAISAASKQIEKYCDRFFNSVDIHEWVQLIGSNALSLKYYPITRVKRAALGSKEALRLTFNNTSGVSACATIADGVLTLSDTVPGSTRKGYAAFTLSNYTSMAALETAIESNTDIDTGWNVEVISEDIPTALAPTSETGSNGGAISLYGPDSSVAATLDHLSGLVTIPNLLNHSDWHWDTGYYPDRPHTNRPANWVYIHYTAGYETIPADLQQTAVEAAVNILDSSKLTNGVTAEKLGDASVNYGNAQTLTDDIKSRLSQYRSWGF